jgi:hypothetical protein
MAGAGTATTAITADQARKKQDQEAARGIMQQAELQRQASDKVQQNIQTLQGSNPDAERAAAETDFLMALQKAQQPGSTAVGGVAGGSQRYAEDVAASKTSSAADATDKAKTQARIDAPRYQRVAEGQDAADLASQLSLVDGASQGQDYLTQLRVNSITPNPWATALGSGLTAYGGAMATKQPAAKKTSISTSTPYVDTRGYA